MSGDVNRLRDQAKRVLMVVANPATASTTGWPVGFWASELTHPWLEFTERGYEVVIASPDGGRVELDAYSDPRHESGYSAHDIVSLGFLSTPALAEQLETTRRLSDCQAADFDAIVVAGGQSPMFTFLDNPVLAAKLAEFYESERVTAALCHGVSALLNVRLSDGSWLVSGKTITGFANVEEDFVDQLMGTKVMPFRIEDLSRERGANYVQGGLWRSYAVRDGRLITGQQQYSGRATAELVIEAVGL